jgi:hypothetical protein
LGASCFVRTSNAARESGGWAVRACGFDETSAG